LKKIETTAKFFNFILVDLTWNDSIIVWYHFYQQYDRSVKINQASRG